MLPPLKQTAKLVLQVQPFWQSNDSGFSQNFKTFSPSQHIKSTFLCSFSANIFVSHTHPIAATYFHASIEMNEKCNKYYLQQGLNPRPWVMSRSTSFHQRASFRLSYSAKSVFDCYNATTSKNRLLNPRVNVERNFEVGKDHFSENLIQHFSEGWS